jgi:hypothetical protein
MIMTFFLKYDEIISVIDSHFKFSNLLFTSLIFSFSKFFEFFIHFTNF